MNGTSPGEPLRITLVAYRLCELHTISVGVEHVHDAHLTCQLQHNPYVEAFAAEPIGIGLDVLHVDRRDAALHRLALGDRDPHPSVLKLRPLVVPVDVRLGEAEHTLVEVATAVEVPDEVPDARLGAYVGHPLRERAPALRGTAGPCAGSRAPRRRR